MKEEARNRRLISRIDNLLENYEIGEHITYTVQEKDNVYQCVISYKKNGIDDTFWTSTGYKTERGNLRKAKEKAGEIAELFKDRVRKKLEENTKNKNESSNIVNIIDFQNMAQLNTTNYDPNKKTKADWDFYEYMEHWLYKIKKKEVDTGTFDGYERQVTNWTKKYFTMEEHKRKVKELTPEDLDEFYDYLREEANLINSTIDHYQDNISNAFKYLLKKKQVRFNPADYTEPIVVEVKEVSTYNQKEINQLLDAMKGKSIKLPTLFDAYYGLRRSEIFGLRKQVFDFENNTFIINHVALQRDGKKHKEKVEFKDKTKSKKGYRSFPIFPEIKEALIERFNEIEENKKALGDMYNYKYDNYICVRFNGDILQPNSYTKEFKKCIKRNNFRHITPHGLRHSIATLLHLRGIDVRDLQDWLGHESITSTNRYTRSDYKKQIATGKVVTEIYRDKGKEKNNKVKRFVIKKKKAIHLSA